MTSPQDFTDRACAAVYAGKPKAIGVLTLLLGALIMGAIGQIGVRVADWLWEHIITGKTAVGRGILRSYVRAEAKRLAKERGAALTREQRQDLEDAAVEGITTAARAMTSEELRALKACAKGPGTLAHDDFASTY